MLGSCSNLKIGHNDNEYFGFYFQPSPRYWRLYFPNETHQTFDMDHLGDQWPIVIYGDPKSFVDHLSPSPPKEHFDVFTVGFRAPKILRLDNFKSYRKQYTEVSSQHIFPRVQLTEQGSRVRDCGTDLIMFDQFYYHPIKRRTYIPTGLLLKPKSSVISIEK